jgi:hypothetical protein
MERLIREIRKFKLDDLLLSIGNVSRDVFSSKDAVKEIIWKKEDGQFIQIQKQLIPAWALSNLAYIAILYSNDNRSNIATPIDIYKMVNLLARIEDDLAEKKLKTMTSEDIYIHIVVGLPQQQFWYQRLGIDIQERLVRFYILLGKIPSHYFPDHRSPEHVLKEKTGFNFEQFFQILFAIWTHSIVISPLININVADDLSKRVPIITNSNLNKCLSYFLENYDYYRTRGHASNPLFFKPLVRTSTNKIIAPNVFLLGRIIYEGAYWILRDYYKQLNSNEFINNFGLYYEKYIENVLNFYLKPDQFKNIPAHLKRKRADWIIYGSEYTIIVEQKSSLMSVSLKQEYPSTEKLDKYLENYIEAYVQIDETINDLDYTDRTKIVKLILHFEILYLSETFRERVQECLKNKIEDLSNFFFIATDEFENLIQILSEKEEIFNLILKEKLEKESKLSISEGKEFRYFIDKYRNTKENSYLKANRDLFENLTDKK